MATTTVLHPHPIPFPSPAMRYLCRSWWTCHSSGRHTWRNRSDALLATDQPISLIPREAQDRLELVISPERGWRGQVPSWFGGPCRVGRVQFWLPIEEDPGRYRDFSLLALLPREDPDDAPPFILLGTQFLLECQAEVHLVCSSLTSPGRLVIP